MSRTLHFFAGHLVPQRGLRYFREYLDEANAINRAAQLGVDAERRHVTAKHWAAIIFILIHSFHHIWMLFAFPADLSARQLLLHYDVPVIEYGNVMFNVVAATYGPMSAFTYYDLYMRSDNRILALLDAILLRGRCSLFATDRFRGTTPCDFLRHWAILFINRFQIFIYLIHLVSVYYHFYAMSGSFLLLNVSFDDSMFDSLMYKVNAFKFYAFMYILANVIILAVTISAIIGISNYVMFKLANQVLLSSRKPRGGNLARRLESHDWRRFHRFRRYFLGTLRHFLYANAWTGKSFTTFLIVNFPLNAYMVMFLLVTELPNTKKLPIILMVNFQFVAMIGLHLAFSMFNTLIHRPSKPLMSLMVRQYFRSTKTKLDHKGKRKCRNYLRDQIQLSHCISAFHTANRYGQTYGKCGLITIATFTKCLMFYGKFMMISYKNIRQIK